MPNRVPPPAFDKEKDNAGVVVAVATEVVNNGLRVPALKLVTVPVPAGRSAATSARNVAVAGDPVVGPAKTVLAFGVSERSATAGCAAVNTPVLEVYDVKKL